MSTEEPEQTKKSPETIRDKVKKEVQEITPDLSGNSFDAVVDWLVTKREKAKVIADKKRNERKLESIHKQRQKLAEEETKLNSEQ